ncbi:MAG: DUF58 domain-containing protein [Xanthomonadaceae bacterium]|jgi:uncharacterized protein (DUF58 family)|nr:DUF58 domain-containing protein [Xanthomonadaceae bacterium]
MLQHWRTWLDQRIATWTRPRDPEPLPVSLSRRRVYILPTPFGYFLAALLLTMCISAINYNNNPALLLALVLGSASLASLILTHLQLLGLSVSAFSAEPVAAGTPLSLRMTLHASDGRRHHGLRLDHAGMASFDSLEEGSGTAEMTLLVPTQQRGWLFLERIGVSSIMPLGLARAQAWIWPEQPLLVYPFPETNGPPLPEGGCGSNRSQAHPLGEDLHQLRNYRSGDPLRTVAWKHSARRDTLLVREFERTQGIEVVLDWKMLSGLSYEQRISRLAHWVDLAERENRRYRLLLPGQPSIGPGQGADHRHLCLRALALLPHDAH